MNKKFIAVIGTGNAEESILKIAEEVGGVIAKKDSILICGGAWRRNGKSGERSKTGRRCHNRNSPE